MRCAFFLLLWLATPATALELFHRETIPMNRPSSLAFDPALCGLWIANEGRQVAFLSASGEITRRIDIGFSAKAVASDGTDLILVDRAGTFLDLDQRTEESGGPYRLAGRNWDIEGMVVGPGATRTFVRDEDARLWRTDLGGNLLWSVDGFALTPPMVEPQGIAIDRRTGAIFVVDDREGSNSLFEFTPDGAFVARVSLAPWGTDPEGLAIQADTGTLWIGFDSDARLAVFDYLPTQRAESAEATSDACVMF
ncbi:MAG: hypothetical protein AAFP13_04595 [Pseudomonadota bacterium]